MFQFRSATRCSAEVSRAKFFTATLVVLVAMHWPAETTAANDLKKFSAVQPKMGSLVTITCYAPDAIVAKQAITAAFQRIDELNRVLSDYDPDSELMRLCTNAVPGKSQRVSEDFARVLEASQQLSRDSCGAFDVSVGPIVRLWRRARRRQEFPPSDLLTKAQGKVGYKSIVFDSKARTLQLNKADMRLDMGGIAKGFAGDEALKAMREVGVNRALIDAGGDVVAGDPPPNREGWVIAVQRLEKPSEQSSKAGEETKPVATAKLILVKNCGVATSGDAFQYVNLDGKRYSHIVDPRTGLALSRSSSVTVIAPSGMAADGLASAVSVLGPQVGLKLIAGKKNTEAFVIQSAGPKLNAFASKGWKAFEVSDTSPDK